MEIRDSPGRGRTGKVDDLVMIRVGIYFWAVWNDVYRGFDSVRRAAEVAPKCLSGSLVMEKKKKQGLESGTYAAKMRQIIEEREREK